MWYFCTLVFKVLAFVYLTFLAKAVFMLMHPRPCKFEALLQDTVPGSAEAHQVGRLYDKHCMDPFWPDAELRLDMSLHLGAGNGDDCLGVSPLLTPVWTLANQSASRALAVNISFTVPRHVVASNSTLCGFFMLNPSPQLSRDEVGSGLRNSDNTSDTLVVFPVTLAQQRVPSKPSTTRRSLLDSPVSSPSLSSSSSSTPTHSLHSPYLHYPVILRHVELYQVLDARSLNRVVVTNLPSRPREDIYISRSTEEHERGLHPRRATERMFNPLLWLDDLSIPARHFFALRPTTIGSSEVVVLGRGQEATGPVMSFEFQFTPTSLLYYNFKRLVQANMRLIRESLGEESLDELRYWLSEDRLFMMLVTQVVGWLHITFEYLAFCDDYQFFKGRKSYRGISASSLVFQLLRSAVLFLYLEDQGTSWLVLSGILKDLLYDGWKVFKILQPTIHLSRSLVPIRIRWGRRSATSSPLQLTLSNDTPVVVSTSTITTDAVPPVDQRQDGDAEDRDVTAEYDMIAVKHGWLCLLPLVLGLPVYYLKFYRYKSWYSWVVSSLVDFIYLFGFLSLTPQIYINYRLQSVAHLPMKAFMYKIFNTFIDDIFAFVVKMPLKHKIMTLRDDLIFVVFVYQWFIYRTDKSRANEFGFQYEQGESQDSREQQDGSPPALTDTTSGDADDRSKKDN